MTLCVPLSRCASRTWKSPAAVSIQIIKTRINDLCMLEALLIVKHCKKHNSKENYHTFIRISQREPTYWTKVKLLKGKFGREKTIKRTVRARNPYGILEQFYPYLFSITQKITRNKRNFGNDHTQHLNYTPYNMTSQTHPKK